LPWFIIGPQSGHIHTNKSRTSAFSPGAAFLAVGVLEAELSRQLDDSVRFISRCRDLPELAATNGGIGVGELSEVEHVEEVRLQLKIQRMFAPGQVRSFRDGHVDIRETGTIEAVAPQCSVTYDVRVAEVARIEI
jgi:hypothetical protein